MLLILQTTIHSGIYTPHLQSKAGLCNKHQHLWYQRKKQMEGRNMKKTRWFILVMSLILISATFSVIEAASGPDLVPINFTSPASAAPGEAVGLNMDCQVKNIGTLSAVSSRGYFNVGFYLSKDTVLDGSDVLLTGGREAVYTPLAPGEIKNVSIYGGMAIPSGTLPGSYYLLAVIDEFADVTELNEGNNVDANPITILAPDLVPIDFVSPGSSTPGGTLPGMACKVKNIGTANAVSSRGYFSVGFYLSTDAVKDGSDVLLTGGREAVNTPLAPGEIKVISIYSGMTIPTGTVPGSYYLLAVIDELSDVTELNEKNNVDPNPITIF
jgi:subtilase family serine protease